MKRQTAQLTDINFISGSPPSAKFHTQIKIRYNSDERPAKIKITSSGDAIVTFEKNCTSVTPGQSAVFYDDKKLLGGGIIKG